MMVTFQCGMYKELTMKNESLFILLGVMTFIPWGFILQPISLGAQIIGLVVQVIGAFFLVINDK